MKDIFSNSLSGLDLNLDESLIDFPLTGPPFSNEYIFASSENFENIFSTPKTDIEFIPVEVHKDPIKRRLNGFDGNILVEHFSFDAENENAFEKIVSAIFPKIYKQKVFSKALKELTSISKIANELITKQIPYGEQDATYEDLITYLSSASSIHAKLKRKKTDTKT